MTSPATPLLIAAQQAAAQPGSATPTPTPSAPAPTPTPTPTPSAFTPEQQKELKTLIGEAVKQPAKREQELQNRTDFMFVATIAFVTILLIWGLSRVAHFLKQPPPGLSKQLKPGPDGDDGKPAQTIGAQALTDETGNGHFSHITGVLGGVILSAMILGVGYWMITKLYYQPEALQQLKHAKDYFLYALAIFAPYAVTKITSIGKESSK